MLIFSVNIIRKFNPLRLYFLQTMTNNLNFFDQFVEELLKSKHSNYSQECINYYVDDDQFHTEDLLHVYNKRNERIKCTLIKHRLQNNNKENDTTINNKCILYLHGLGSSRLQSLTIIKHLPKNYCLCMFDMTGSGKSGGEFITYGLKEQEDIDPVINYLLKRKFIRQFIIWGRSMGAVASLLYAIQHFQQNNSQSELSVNHSLRNSLINCKSSLQLNQNSYVKAIVLDSPFHNFRDIAKEIAIKHFSIPSFILDVALDYVQQSLNKILANKIGQKYNPFNINFNKPIKLSIPIIFLYSEKDEVVSSNHSQKIIKNIQTIFQRLLINDCSHNQARPDHVIQQIFKKLEKYNRQKYYQYKRLSESLSKDMTISYSCERKRGIFVYTPSKDKEYKTIQHEDRPIHKLHKTIDIQNQKYDLSSENSPKVEEYRARKGSMSISSSKISTQSMKGSQLRWKQRFVPQSKHLMNIATIDTETNDLINKKLIATKEASGSVARKLRSKRFTVEKRNDIKLSHHRYLQ